MSELVPLIALGLFVGTLIGGLGGGGGVIAVPLFMWTAGMSPLEAGTYSLIAVAAAAVVAVLIGAFRREIDWRWAMTFGIVGAIGSVLGSAIAIHVDHRIILLAFALVVVLASVRFVMSLVQADSPASRSRRSTPISLSAAAGIGATTGLVGVGGGFLISPTLMGIVRLTPRTAVATSSAVILLNCVSSLGARFILGTQIETAWMWPVLIGALAGGAAGKQIGAKLSPRALQFGSAALLVISCLAVVASLIELFVQS